MVSFVLVQSILSYCCACLSLTQTANSFCVIAPSLNLHVFASDRRAVSNATSGGSARQIKALVDLGVIAAMCDLLTVHDTKILLVRRMLFGSFAHLLLEQLF